MMTEEERNREKEIKYEMYIRSEQIRILKKELSKLKQELISLGDNKERRYGNVEEGKRLVRRK